MVEDRTEDTSGPHQPPPRWCVVGNVVAQRLHGEQGEQRPGSKLFTGGTRVYFRSAYWGIGGECVTVLGIGRRPRRWITATVRTSLIENWRAAFVHTPRVLQELRDDNLPDGEGDTRALADVMNRVGVTSSWRLVARTPAECHQVALASGARPLTSGSTPSGDEQDQALILYRGIEPMAGLVYQAAVPVPGARHTAPFTCSYLWLRPLTDPAETFFTALQTRFPGHDLGALHARMRTPLPT